MLNVAALGRHPFNIQHSTLNIAFEITGVTTRKTFPIAILLFRPSGLFGKYQAEKV
jgi:hypothetical protein